MRFVEQDDWRPECRPFLRKPGQQMATGLSLFSRQDNKLSEVNVVCRIPLDVVVGGYQEIQ